MGKRSKSVKNDGPSAALLRVARSVVADPVERDRFVASLGEGTGGRKVVIELNEPVTDDRSTLPPWAPSWVREARPVDRPAHDQGDLYALDLSSVFCAAPLCEVSLESPQMLDVCAAPGGKAVFAYRALSPSVLVANEVIGKRVPILISNFERCGVSPAAVISRDPSVLARDFPGTFDVVVVDAPCSGQSLLARGEGQSGAFHPSTINMNSNRQKRIVANAAQCVRPGGYLLYSTCTFSREENEGVIDWLLKKFPMFGSCQVEALQELRSNETAAFCYRLFPQQGFGSGGFCALLKAQGEAEVPKLDLSEFRAMWKRVEGKERRFHV